MIDGRPAIIRKVNKQFGVVCFIIGLSGGICEKIEKFEKRTVTYE
jgi:hypothetical protein